MRAPLIGLALLGSACAPGARAQTPVAAPVPADSVRVTPGTDSSRSYGTLSQADLSLRLRSDELEIRFVPLSERVIRLLAPDAYQSIRGLLASRRTAIDSIARRSGVSNPGIALVTFFAQRDGARFDPQLITLTSRGRQLRPAGVVALSPSFSAQQLNVRDQAVAIFIFEDAIPVDEPFSLTYNALTSDDWERKLPILERERARVNARLR